MLPKSTFPYTGPLFGPSDARGPDESHTVLALKRAMRRGGYGENFDLSDAYGIVLENALQRFQQAHSLWPSGQYGTGTWQALRSARVKKGPNAGEYLMDRYACALVRKDTEVDPAVRARELIRAYCEEAALYDSGIHYRQFRPMNHLGIPPKRGFTTDCSGFVTGVYFAAGAPDPNGYGYNGLGWTGSLYSHNRRLTVGPPYEIGDLSLYGSSLAATKHTTIYMGEDVWLSHGSEAGPYGTLLHYRSDLICVVRPELVKT